MPEKLTCDPSQFFVGGEFTQYVDNLPVHVSPVPQGLAQTIGPCEVLSRADVLQAYYKRSNQLISADEIKPPTVHLDKRTKSGLIINPGRAQRPQGEALVPIAPGNEHLTPPPLLVIRKNRENDPKDPAERINSNNWLVRLFPNAFAYGYPRWELLSEKGSRRIETVCALSLVAALNPEKRPLHDIWAANGEVMELLLYTIAATSRIIMNQADYLYLDQGIVRKRKFDAVLGFINQGKGAGGSLPWPHAQILALTRENTQPLYLGDETEEKDGIKQCGRCQRLGEKLGAGDRLIKQTENVAVYAPWSEGVSKGQVIRISPTRHFANLFEGAFANPNMLRDLARLTHQFMYAMALDQKGVEWPNADLNVIFAQDIAKAGSHLFVDIRTGYPNGGFGIITPVYEGIQPVVVYQDPADTAQKFKYRLTT